MTLLQVPARLHVTLPAPLLAALRARYPHLSLATAVREALAVALRPDALTLQLPPALRAEISAHAAAHGLTVETATLTLLRAALPAAASTPPRSLEVQLFTLATARQILELALDHDPQRVADYIRVAQEWVDACLGEGGSS